mmetsp:Transcript_10486/g.21058  ORF Transcript_10486/g.21058 Transcript_10486/m.21058 type:complete len:687 (-) Transcript_10486:608-2668(-)
MDLETECINSIRSVSIDMVQAANSGHPGAPMGCAPIAYVLWKEIMKYSSSSPDWINRDRFVLSNGHASALQYAMLHLAGYKDCKMDDLKAFRVLGSTTPGHPENFMTAGVEVSTGPLGQGISNAVGMAMAETHLAATYNTTEHKIFDNKTYVLCGDGCLQEGVSAEACSMAGHLKLGKLMVLYDDNNITIDGGTDLSFTEDVAKRYEAYNWHVQKVGDISKGLDELRAAIAAADAVTDKPSIICITTVIGEGSPKLAGKSACHGSPLGAEEALVTKTAYGMPNPDQTFQISDAVGAVFKESADKGEAALDAWQKVMDSYAAANPEKAQEIQRRFAGELPEGVFDDLPDFVVGKDKDQATRKYSQACLNALCPKLPEILGGSADLTPSNCAFPADVKDYQADTPDGKYIRFGVREHAMAALCNGLFAYGGLRPYCATYVAFVGYCMGSLRLSALSKFGVVYVFTHDSINVGCDGPTHQPIEAFEQIRSMPNIHLWRPADSYEMNAAYIAAMTNKGTPSVISCSRAPVMGIDVSSAEKASKGAYIAVASKGTPDLIIVSTGGEFPFSVKALPLLAAEGIDVALVSMPCQDVFLQQTQEYQASILPGNIPTLSVEASATHGWHRFSHAQIGMDNVFGLSANGDRIYEHFGFTPENIANKGKALVDFYKGRTVPALRDVPFFEPFAKPLH